MPAPTPSTEAEHAPPAGRCRWHHLPGPAQLAFAALLERDAGSGVLARTELAEPPDALWIAAVGLGALTLAVPEAFPLHLARLAGDGLVWATIHAALSWLGLTLSFVGFAGILRRLRIDRQVPLTPGRWLLAQGVLTWDGRWLSFDPIPAAHPRVVPGHGPAGTQLPELRWGTTHFLLPAGVRPPELVARLGRQRRAEDDGGPPPLPWEALRGAIAQSQQVERPAQARADHRERWLVRVAVPAALLLTPPLCPDEVRTLLSAVVEGPHMAREVGAGARLHLRASGLARVAPPPGRDAAFIAAATTAGTTTHLIVDSAAGTDADAAVQRAVIALADRFGGLPPDMRVHARRAAADSDPTDEPTVLVQATPAGTEAWLQLSRAGKRERWPLLSVGAASSADAPTAPGPRGSATPPEQAPPAPAAPPG